MLFLVLVSWILYSLSKGKGVDKQEPLTSLVSPIFELNEHVQKF